MAERATSFAGFFDTAPATPAAGEDFTGFFDTSTPGGGAFEAAAERTSRSVRKGTLPTENASLLRDPDIDYETGANMDMRVLLSRASNPQEATKLLSTRYGEGGYGQDKRGNWWVEEGGKRVAVFPANTSWGNLAKNTGAGFVASGPQTAGAIGGGVIGGALGGPFGGVAGAMAGGALGKGYDEAVKYFQGFLDKPPGEVAGGMLTEGAIAGAFQGAGPAVRAGTDALKPAIRNWFGVTPASSTMGREIMAEGVSPPIGSLAPSAKSLEYKRDLRAHLIGDPREAERQAYVAKRVEGMFREEGIPEDQIQKLMRDIYDRSAAVSTQEAGQALVGRAGDIQRGLLQEAATTRATADRALQSVDNTLRLFARPSGNLATDVSGAITAARTAFGRDMRAAYTQVDNMTGNVPLVPTDGIRAAARDLVDIMPPEAVPPLLRRLAADPVNAAAPEMLTFAQAHALRTTLREMGDVTGLGGVGQRAGSVRRVAGAVDRAIGSTGDQLGDQAAAALRALDTRFAQGISRFEDATLNQLVRDTRSGLPAEPGYVAKTLMDTQQVNTARHVVGMLPPATRAEVVKADLQNLIEGASVTRPDGTRMIDGKVFHDILEQRRELMNAVYGQSREGQRVLPLLRAYARDLAVLDGKLDPSAIRSPTALTDTLQRAAGAARAVDEFARTNPLGALTSGKPGAVDRAAASLIQPGNSEMTVQAARTLGVDSPEWMGVRRYAFSKLISDAVVETPSLGKQISGKSIDDALGGFTKQQQDVLFPNGLADDLRLLGKEVRFLFPRDPRDFGTSLAAAEIKKNVPFSLHADLNYAWTLVEGYIADHPKLIRYLANEIKTNPTQARSTMSVLGQWIVNSARTGPGTKPAMRPLEGDFTEPPALPIPATGVVPTTTKPARERTNLLYEGE